MKLTLNTINGVVELSPFNQGGKAFVYLGSDGMIYSLVDYDYANEKHFLIDAYIENNPHTPFVEHLGQTNHDGMMLEVFRMPLYHPLNVENKALIDRIGRLLIYGSGLLSDQMKVGNYPPLLVQAIQSFEQVANKYQDVDWDLHAKNVMQDENGNLVFIDPIRQLDELDEQYSEDWYE